MKCAKSVYNGIGLWPTNGIELDIERGILIENLGGMRTERQVSCVFRVK